MKNEVKCEEKESLHQSNLNSNSGKNNKETLKSVLENMNGEKYNNKSFISNSMPNIYNSKDNLKQTKFETFKKLKKNLYLTLVVLMLLYLYYVYMSVSKHIF